MHCYLWWLKCGLVKNGRKPSLWIVWISYSSFSISWSCSFAQSCWCAEESASISPLHHPPPPIPSCMSVFDRRRSHTVPARNVSSDVLCAHLSLTWSICELKNRQTWHRGHPTCPWQNAVNPLWHLTSQRLHAHTHQIAAGTPNIWLARLPHLGFWHFHWEPLFAFEIDLIDPALSKAPNPYVI